MGIKVGKCLLLYNVNVENHHVVELKGLVRVSSYYNKSENSYVYK